MAIRAHAGTLMSTQPIQFPQVTVVAKANVYFGGDVVSHTVLFPGNIKKTLGIIRPGSFHFGTDAPERMEVIAGSCEVTLDGQTKVTTYGEGTYFDVSGKSGFTIKVASGLCEYVCSFLS